MIFTFMGYAYEVPDGIDINVFRFDDGCVDFDLTKNGKPLSIKGPDGTTFEQAGVRTIGRVAPTEA